MIVDVHFSTNFHFFHFSTNFYFFSFVLFQLQKHYQWDPSLDALVKVAWCKKASRCYINDVSLWKDYSQRPSFIQRVFGKLGNIIGRHQNFRKRVCAWDDWQWRWGHRIFMPMVSCRYHLVLSICLQLVSESKALRHKRKEMVGLRHWNRRWLPCMSRWCNKRGSMCKLCSLITGFHDFRAYQLRVLSIFWPLLHSRMHLLLIVPIVKHVVIKSLHVEIGRWNFGMFIFSYGTEILKLVQEILVI